MRGAQAAEIMAFHGTGKTFTDRHAGRIDLLALDKMRGGQFGTDINQIIGADTELSDAALGFDFGFGEMAAHGAACALHFGETRAELHS